MSSNIEYTGRACPFKVVQVELNGEEPYNEQAPCGTDCPLCDVEPKKLNKPELREFTIYCGCKPVRVSRLVEKTDE